MIYMGYVALHHKEETAYQIVVGRPEEKKPLEPLLVYDRIILK
jgi:hypothetical protein